MQKLCLQFLHVHRRKQILLPVTFSLLCAPTEAGPAAPHHNFPANVFVVFTIQMISSNVYECDLWRIHCGSVTEQIRFEIARQRLQRRMTDGARHWGRES